MFFLGILYSNEKIKFDYPDSLFIKQTLDSLILAKNSMALKYELIHYDNEFKDIIYKPFYNSNKLDTVIITSDKSIKTPYLKHMSKNFSNFYIDKEINTNIEKKKKKIRNKYYFIRDEPEINIGRYRSDQLGMLVNIYPKFDNYFSGIFGGAKAQDDRWKLNGEIDAHFENIWGSTEKLIFQWKNIDSTNQKFNFELHRPHLLKSGLGMILKANYELINNNYTHMSYEINLELLNGHYGSYYIGYIQGLINATDGGINKGFVSSEYNAFSFLFRNNSLNDMIMPTSGSKTNFELEIGKDNEIENFYVRYKNRSEIHMLISDRLNMCFKLFGEYINAINSDVGFSRKVSFGGVNSLRGYDDNRFSSSSVAIPAVEFQYNDKNLISPVFFFEGGFSKDHSPKISYGLGLKKITNNAIVNIEYAIPLILPFNEGKVHIKWLTRL